MSVLLCWKALADSSQWGRNKRFDFYSSRFCSMEMLSWTAQTQNNFALQVNAILTCSWGNPTHLLKFLLFCQKGRMVGSLAEILDPQLTLKLLKEKEIRPLILLFLHFKWLSKQTSRKMCYFIVHSCVHIVPKTKAAKSYSGGSPMRWNGCRG